MLAGLLVAALPAFPPPHEVAVVPTGAGPCGAAAGFGAVWVAADGAGTLVRIDPRRTLVTRRIRLAPGSCFTAVGAGAVWVVNEKAGTLVRVDPRTYRIRTVVVGRVPFDVLLAYGRVWVTAWDEGVLVEVDPASLAVVRRIEVGPRPSGLAARRGAVWVGFGRDATAIARFDPATGAVTRFPGTGAVLAHLHVGRTLAQGAEAPDEIWFPDKSRASSTESTRSAGGSWTRFRPVRALTWLCARSARCGC